jgi:sulfur transfer protein SufE
MRMNLQEALSHQRLNGFPGILSRMKRVAFQEMGVEQENRG